MQTDPENVIYNLYYSQKMSDFHLCIGKPAWFFATDIKGNKVKYSYRIKEGETPKVNWNDLEYVGKTTGVNE